jgi:hypothetical protein
MANHPLNPFALGEPFGNPATHSKPMGYFWNRRAITVKESQDPGKDGVQREHGKL